MDKQHTCAVCATMFECSDPKECICPMTCIWCDNEETKAREEQIGC